MESFSDKFIREHEEVLKELFLLRNKISIPFYIGLEFYLIVLRMIDQKIYVIAYDTKNNIGHDIFGDHDGLSGLWERVSIKKVTPASPEMVSLYNMSSDYAKRRLRDMCSTEDRRRQFANKYC